MKVWGITLYPFGGEQRAITNLVDNRYRFTGLERDGETGLDHAWFRKHSPNLARWLSRDPICSNCLNPQSLNRYSYVANNPTSQKDPSGLDKCLNGEGQIVDCPWGPSPDNGGANYW